MGDTPMPPDDEKKNPENGNDESMAWFVRLSEDHPEKLVVVAISAVAVFVVGFIVLLFSIFRIRQLRRRRELEEHSIDPDTLHDLITKKQEILVFDVRQPLDLLAHSEIIPGSKRIAPKEVLEEASLIPKEKDSVIYCTCVSESTSRMILEKALALNFTRIKFLKGGLAAWKEKGYPVERYTTPFHLDTAS